MIDWVNLVTNSISYLNFVKEPLPQQNWLQEVMTLSFEMSFLEPAVDGKPSLLSHIYYVTARDCNKPK